MRNANSLKNTNVCGMNPAAVATLFLVTKILDAVNDPVIGYIMDHLPKFKMGRFKPYILIFVPVMAINFMLVFIGPALVPAGLKLLVAYITYIAIGITFTLANVPMNAIYPAATDGPKD